MKRDENNFENSGGRVYYVNIGSREILHPMLNVSTANSQDTLCIQREMEKEKRKNFIVYKESF